MADDRIAVKEIVRTLLARVVIDWEGDEAVFYFKPLFGVALVGRAKAVRTAPTTEMREIRVPPRGRGAASCA